ncbi:MAG: 3-phosphoshikimate 1-carboxyvinyltransferase [Polyangiaceae bacterium]|nr:3-phosphoshikimate 1-carboxyvinyltransferase [Polyangiaceae bacterium]
MTTLVVHPADRPLRGSAPVPRDDRLGLGAVLLAALAEGESRIVAAARAPDTAAAMAAARALGASVEIDAEGAVVVRGTGLHGLRAPERVVDCAGGHAARRCLCGLLAGQPFRTELAAEPDDARTAAILQALRARGAAATPAPGGFAVGPLPDGRRLGAIEVDSQAGDPDLKDAVLLSGLFASSVTRYREPAVSRDHLERALDARGVPIRTVGPVIELDPRRWDGKLPALEVHVPGDLAAAAALVAAAQVVPGSRVDARDVGVNRTRAGFLEIARDMGAGLDVEAHGERHGEPVATVHAWFAPLRAVQAGGEMVARATCDVPLVCALASRAAGTTRVRDAGAGAPWAPPAGAAGDGPSLGDIAALLAAFGVSCSSFAGGIDVTGRDGPLAAAEVDARGDAALAMTATILALGAGGPSAPSRVHRAEAIAVRYPKFVATLRALGARIDVES